MVECQNCGGNTEKPSSVEAKNFRKNRAQATTGNIEVCERCFGCYTGRQTASERILTSKEEKRLIVAGPGTGKSHTFGEVLRQLPDGSTAMVFTFINNLVDELEKDLSGIEGKDINVNTLHGFCKQLLYSKAKQEDLAENFEYFPKLSALIEADASLLEFGFTQKQFKSAFALINEGAELEFYMGRGAYYNAVSHDDIVYRVYDFFNKAGDAPTYSIVIVDEYQDFNALEAAFINLLAKKNKILIAGDDDQALYAFRDASTKYIRDLHTGTDFENLRLPYCSRCTPVLVEATNHLVEQAKARGLLNGRVERDYECYWPDKYREHGTYPSIEVARCSVFDPTVVKYVERRILSISDAEEITGEERDLPFIIIGPESGYHLDQVKTHLINTLDATRFEVIDSRKEKSEIQMQEGYQILRRGHNNNLGWRIVLHNDPLPNLNEIIKSTYEGDVELESLLPNEYKTKHRAFFEAPAEEEAVVEVEAPKQKIRVLLTNYLGSKGLSALHSIVIGMNNFDFPSNPTAITDSEVCRFIVALTRAKNSCALVANKTFDRRIRRSVDRPSEFLSWLPQDKLNSKAYRASDFE